MKGYAASDFSLPEIWLPVLPCISLREMRHSSLPGRDKHEGREVETENGMGPLVHTWGKKGQQKRSRTWYAEGPTRSDQRKREGLVKWEYLRSEA